MRYQIIFEEALQIFYDYSPSIEEMALHFANNGYDPIYIYRNDSLDSVVTFEDFQRKQLISGINRNFIRQYKTILNRQIIEQDFCSNLDSDCLIYVSGGRVICEVNALIKLPIQNSIAKNIMSLRYVGIFKSELQGYFDEVKSVLILSSQEIYSYLCTHFPKVNFIHSDDYNSANYIIESENIDVVFDFVYNKKIRKIIQFTHPNVVDLCKVLTPFALERLKTLSSEKGVSLKFYKLPRYADLTCLNSKEIANSEVRKMLGELIQNQEYIKAFVRSEDEYYYLKKKHYHSSQRLDNGFCFVMDESRDSNQQVRDGIRINGNGEKKAGHIYNFYGPCTAYGFLVRDELTVPALVEKYAEDDGIDVRTHNRAGIHGDNELNSIMGALSVPVAPGDAHVFLDVLEDLPVDNYPNFCYVKEWFNTRKSKEEVQFMDFPGHCNSDSNRIMADYIYEDIKNIETTMKKEESDRKPLLAYNFDDYDVLSITHSSYIKQKRIIRKRMAHNHSFGEIGVAIVPDNMNYDLAIFYLQRCIKECDFLYILFPNANVERVETHKRIYDACGKYNSVVAIPLEYFFDVMRYTDCNQGAVFTERALNDMCERYLKANVRFLIDCENYKWWNQIVFAEGNRGIMKLKEIKVID